MGHQHGRRFIVWGTNMAAVTSCENTIYILKVSDFRVLPAYLLEPLVGEYPHVRSSIYSNPKKSTHYGNKKVTFIFRRASIWLLFSPSEIYHLTFLPLFQFPTHN